MTKKDVIDALGRCIQIGTNGFLCDVCEGCPMAKEDRIKEGYTACESYDSLHVDIPYDLAMEVMTLLKADTIPLDLLCEFLGGYCMPPLVPGEQTPLGVKEREEAWMVFLTGLKEAKDGREDS